MTGKSPTSGQQGVDVAVAQLEHLKLQTASNHPTCLKLRESPDPPGTCQEPISPCLSDLKEAVQTLLAPTFLSFISNCLLVHNLHKIELRAKILLFMGETNVCYHKSLLRLLLTWTKVFQSFCSTEVSDSAGVVTWSCGFSCEKPDERLKDWRFANWCQVWICKTVVLLSDLEVLQWHFWIKVISKQRALAGFTWQMTREQQSQLVLVMWCTLGLVTKWHQLEIFMSVTSEDTS